MKTDTLSIPKFFSLFKLQMFSVKWFVSLFLQNSFWIQTASKSHSWLWANHQHKWPACSLLPCSAVTKASKRYFHERKKPEKGKGNCKTHKLMVKALEGLLLCDFSYELYTIMMHCFDDKTCMRTLDLRRTLKAHNRRHRGLNPTSNIQCKTYSPLTLCFVPVWAENNRAAY